MPTWKCTGPSVALGRAGSLAVFPRYSTRSWLRTSKLGKSVGSTYEVPSHQRSAVVLMHEYRRGKGSGIEVETDTAVVFTVRQGRVIRIQG